VLKIQRPANGPITLRLSGRIEPADIDELRRIFEMGATDQDLALDLGDVTLVDRDALMFLARCEMEGVKLKNCPRYVRQGLKKGETRPEEQ
jgi:hypothetical protein